MVLVPYEHAEGMSAFQTVLAGLIDDLGQAKETGSKPEVFVFIGPEGGFEDDEIELAIQAGAVPVSLGKRILRTETAGLTALSILMYEIECAGEKGK